MNNIATVNTSMNMFDAMDKAYKFACIMAKSDIVPSHYRGKPENTFIAVQTAYRMNLDPMQVMQNTYVVSGKLGMVSSFAISLANQSGLFDSGIRYRVEGSGEDLKVTAFANLKKTGEEISYTITMREAIAENWTKNPKYKTLPALMLRYRAATLLIRTHAPEVFNGMHMVEEIEDSVLATKDVTPKAQNNEDITSYNHLEIKSQVVSNKLDSILDDFKEEHAEELTNDTLEELLELIKLHNVPSQVIEKWCSKAGVQSIADLDEDKQLACLEYINKQYNYAQDMEAA